MRKVYLLLVWCATCLVSLATAAAQMPSWTRVESFSGGTIWSLIADSSGAVYAEADSGTFRSLDDGATWTEIDAYRIVSTRNALLRVSDSTVDRSTDAGSAWSQGTAVRSNDTIDDFDVIGAAPWGTVYLFEWSINRSTNDGQTWERVESDGWSVFNVSIAFGQDGRIFTGNEGSIAWSPDSGRTWNSSILISDDTVQTIVVTDAGTVIGGTGGSGIMRSTDNGVTWSMLRSLGGITGPTIHSIVQVPSGDLFLTTVEGGLLRSTDDGQSWTAANNGIADPQGFNAIVRSSRGWLFAGGEGGRLYRSNATVAAPDQASGLEHVDVRFDELVNAIRVTSGNLSSRPYKFDLFTLRGEHVIGTTGTSLGASWNLPLDMAPLPSGVYFYRIAVDELVEQGTVSIKR